MGKTNRKVTHNSCGLRKPRTTRTFKLNEASAEALSEQGFKANCKRWRRLPTDRDDVFVASYRESRHNTATERKLARIGNVSISADNRHGWLLISTALETDLSISAKTPAASRSMSLGNCQGRYVYAIQGHVSKWWLSYRNQPKGWLTIDDYTFSLQELWRVA